MLNDPLANALSNILNQEKIGRKECFINPVSKTIKKVLEVFNSEGYLGTYNEIKDGKGNILQVNLLGNINNCNVIKPRFSIKANNFEKFEKKYLPAKNFGILVVSTPKGIMTHNHAKEIKTGGVLVAYCY